MLYQDCAIRRAFIIANVTHPDLIYGDVIILQKQLKVHRYVMLFPILIHYEN